MTKGQIKKLALSDNLIIRFSGKKRIAYIIFRKAININLFKAYEKIVNAVNYKLITNTK